MILLLLLLLATWYFVELLWIKVVYTNTEVNTATYQTSTNLYVYLYKCAYNQLTGKVT